MAKVNRLSRVSKEMRLLINKIKARYIMEGKPVPSHEKITKIIADNTDLDRLLKNVFIRF